MSELLPELRLSLARAQQPVDDTTPKTNPGHCGAPRLSNLDRVSDTQKPDELVSPGEPARKHFVQRIKSSPAIPSTNANYSSAYAGPKGACLPNLCDACEIAAIRPS